MAARRIMILGAGIFQVPLIQTAHQMKIETIVLSYRESDPGLRIAGRSYICSTTDKKGVLEIAQKEKIDAIITAASEIAVPTVSFVADQLNLPGILPEVANLVCHKPSFKKFLCDNSIACPEFRSVHTIFEALDVTKQFSFPVFIKPAEASGSKGAFRINDAGELKEYFTESQSNSYHGEIIIEKFIHGKEIGGEAVICKGEIIFFQPTQKFITDAFVPYTHLLPHNLTSVQLNKASSLIFQTSKSLGIENANINFDIIFDQDEPMLIDLGLRLGGNCLPQLMKLHTGFNTLKAAIQFSLGDEIDLPDQFESNPVAAYIIIGKQGPHDYSLKNHEEAPGELESHVVAFDSYSYDNTVTEHDNHVSHPEGYFIFKGDSSNQLTEIIEKVHSIDWNTLS